MVSRIVLPRMRALSGHINRHIGSRFGDGLGFWYVIEYPKSGGTWLSQMLSDYLALPFPQNSLLPATHPAVLHSHWKYTKNLSNVFYLARDGRDVMVSYYYMRMRAVKRAYYRHDLLYKRSYENLYGKGFDLDDIVSNMPKFIEHEMLYPRGSRINWPSHVTQWWHPENRNIFCLKYEELLADCQTVLARGLSKFDVDVDDWQLRHTVKRFDFKRLTGRRPGEIDNNAFLRSGTAGQWKNCFSKDASEVFKLYMGGDALVHLGYEE